MALRPIEIKGALLQELYAYRTYTMSARYKLDFLKLKAEEKASANRLRLAVQGAIRDLENSVLDEIRDELQANEKELLEGTVALEDALTGVKKIKEVLQVAGKLIDIVAKVVAAV